VFDIDGVLLRGKTPLSEAASSLLKLTNASVPWILMTNGGGETEASKAAALTKILGVSVHERQIVLSHTPMQPLCASLGASKVLVLGCRDVRGVARAYGLTNALTAADVHADDPSIYPFLPAPTPPVRFSEQLRAQKWAAVLVLHDPNSWGLEIQVAIDVLRGGGSGSEQVVPLYCSNGDLTFAGAHPVERLAAGAFSVALKAAWAATVRSDKALEATFFGKPETAQFDYAAKHLTKWSGVEKFSRIVMVGDNPKADVRGANRAGPPWESILVRSGLWRGYDNDEEDPAHHVVDGVGDAVRKFL
jgi:HAD superfamily hydrolase (TIGR01456 family)